MLEGDSEKEFIVNIYKTCSQNYDICKFFEYDGIKGYEFQLNSTISNSVETVVDIVQINSFNLDEETIQVVNHSNSTELSDFEAVDHILSQ